jgi:putative two-component system response regulator
MTDKHIADNRKLIMLVDDSLANLMVGKEALSSAYSVLTVPSALKMFEMLDRYSPQLILLDVDMPRMNGYEAIKILKKNPGTQEIPVIFLTAMVGDNSELMGLSLGAVDYIAKPFSVALLKKRVELHLLVKSQKQALQDYNDKLQDIVIAKTYTVFKLQNKVLQAMAELVEGRDTSTGNHIERTQQCLRVLLHALMETDFYKGQTTEWDLEVLLQSSQLHDVGKIAIQDSILKKPGKLTDEEFQEMKNHVAFGVSFIERLEEDEDDSLFLSHARTFAKYHHEKWDGSGYPDGIAGTDIPLLGRLMAIVDVYEALTSVRPYKKAFDHQASVEIIRQGKGTHFDPALVEIFERCSEKLRLLTVTE